MRRPRCVYPHTRNTPTHHLLGKCQGVAKARPTSSSYRAVHARDSSRHHECLARTEGKARRGKWLQAMPSTPRSRHIPQHGPIARPRTARCLCVRGSAVWPPGRLPDELGARQVGDVVVGEAQVAGPSLVVAAGSEGGGHVRIRSRAEDTTWRQVARGDVGSDWGSGVSGVSEPKSADSNHDENGGPESVTLSSGRYTVRSPLSLHTRSHAGVQSSYGPIGVCAGAAFSLRTLALC